MLLSPLWKQQTGHRDCRCSGRKRSRRIIGHSDSGRSRAHHALHIGRMIEVCARAHGAPSVSDRAVRRSGTATGAHSGREVQRPTQRPESGVARASWSAALPSPSWSTARPGRRGPQHRHHRRHHRRGHRHRPGAATSGTALLQQTPACGAAPATAARRGRRTLVAAGRRQRRHRRNRCAWRRDGDCRSRSSGDGGRGGGGSGDDDDATIGAGNADDTGDDSAVVRAA